MVVSVPMPSYTLDFCIFTKQMHFSKFALMYEYAKTFVAFCCAGSAGYQCNEDSKPET